MLACTTSICHQFHYGVAFLELIICIGMEKPFWNLGWHCQYRDYQPRWISCLMHRQLYHTLPTIIPLHLTLSISKRKRNYREKEVGWNLDLYHSLLQPITFSAPFHLPF